MKSLIAICFCFLLVSNNQLMLSQSIEEQLKKADEIKESDYSNALLLYENVLKSEPDNFDAMFEASLLNTKLGKRADNPKSREEQYERAMDLAKKCLAQNPDDYRSHFMMAAAIGRVSEIWSPKERVASTKEIQKYAQQALELNPSHAGSWHILGKLNARLSNMSMMEKAAANLLFGGLPEDVSNEQAIEFFTKAMNFRGDYILYKLDCAVTYYQIGDKENAKRLFNTIIEMPSITNDDDEYKRQAASLLNRI